MSDEEEIIEKTEDSPITKDALLSYEKLDRESPELFPVPGLGKFVKENSEKIPIVQPENPKNLSQEDIKLMYQLGNLDQASLISEIKKIYDEGYQLGLEEAKEMTRGKFLNIFSRKK